MIMAFKFPATGFSMGPLCPCQWSPKHPSFPTDSILSSRHSTEHIYTLIPLQFLWLPPGWEGSWVHLDTLPWVARREGERCYCNKEPSKHNRDAERLQVVC